MISNDNESSTKTVTSESNRNSSIDINATMSSTNVSVTDTHGAEQTVQPKSNDQLENSTENTTNEQEYSNEQEPQQDDEFIRITAAHQILTEAQTYDDQKNYPAALHLYRICVDLLLEELMFTEGTEQSRVYLREKCTAIMDHIDFLKTKLEPIPLETLISSPSSDQTTETITKLSTTTTKSTTENENSKMNPPTDELNSLHLS